MKTRAHPWTQVCVLHTHTHTTQTHHTDTPHRHTQSTPMDTGLCVIYTHTHTRDMLACHAFTCGLVEPQADSEQREEIVTRAMLRASMCVYVCVCVWVSLQTSVRVCQVQRALQPWTHNRTPCHLSLTSHTRNTTPHSLLQPAANTPVRPRRQLQALSYTHLRASATVQVKRLRIE